MAMASEGRKLHIFLFPFMAQGHTIPMINLAKLFASHGVKITIVTTPKNSIFISQSIRKFTTEIQLLILKFPCEEVGLPEGIEHTDSITGPEMAPKFLKAVSLLEGPLERALLEKRADCLVADVLLPWTTDVAAKVGIPRLILYVCCILSACAHDLIRLHEPQKHVSHDSEPFIIPDLPKEIKISKMKLTDIPFMEDIFNKAGEADLTSYGIIMNSFYELEPDFADCYKNVLGRKAWNLGPLFLWNKEEKALRGRESTIDDEHECLKWLDSKKPMSVVYICFGSMTWFNSAQLKEIAYGLEACGQEFIWVVRTDNPEEEWLPEGFKERMEGKGLIIRGWAPQVQILDHAAVGAFVTHSGWNSTLEGVVAGIPMVTWPIGADHFFNEILVTHVLRIGVPVGVQKFVIPQGDFIKREAIERAISRSMEGEEAEGFRIRAKELAEKAAKAVAKNGSSYSDLNALIEGLKTLMV